MAGVPKLIILGVTAWQLAIVAWLSLAGMVGWLAYSATESVAIGIIAAIALQIIGLGICAAVISSLVKRFQMKRTKAIIKAAQEACNADT